jgi:hypothetical protein
MNYDRKKTKDLLYRPTIPEIDSPIFEATTEGLDSHALSEQLDFVNRYLSTGHARGRSHSVAAVLNGKAGYFFSTSLNMGRGERRECILFSTLVDRDIVLTDLR